jgi:ribosome-associated translation inhibitor RaiA
LTFIVKNIEGFLDVDLKSIAKKFCEEKICDEIHISKKIENGEIILEAKNENEDIVASSKNRDPFFAKAKLLEKLREKLRKIKKTLPVADFSKRKIA